MQLKIKINIDFKIGHLIKYFILSDLFFISGWGLISPILAIFIVDSIPGATVATVGIAAAIYWILKALIQLPISMYLDKTEGETDEFYILLGSLFLASIVAFVFVFVDKIWHLYALQIFHALAFAMYTPAWTGIFSRHLDPGRYSFDWTLNSTVIALASGLSGAVGGFAAKTFGFSVIFIGASVLSLIAALIIFFVPDIVLPRQSSPGKSLIRDHRPQNIGH